MKKPFSLLIKPTSADCNLRCDYCFYINHLDKEKKTRLSFDVLESMIKSYMGTEQPQYVFGWQGGEPTLMGLDFFKKALEFQKKYASPNSVIANSLQTNGTLITDEMAVFFTEHNFLLGISLDGPADIHNYYRKTVSGKSTHSLVLRGIDLLRKNKTEFNILSLVTDKSIDRAKDVYSYLVKNNFHFHQYIPCVEWDENGELMPYSIKGKGWGNFLCEVFDLWKKKDTDDISIRLFDSILTYLIDGHYILCQMDDNCCQYFVVEYNGDVYPCDFHVREDLKLGNIMENTWDDLLESPLYKEFGRTKEIWNKKCNSCKYLQFCHGDCLKNRFLGYDKPKNLSILCEGWKVFYKHALPELVEIAERIKVRRRIVSPSFNIKIGRNDQCPCGSGKKFKNCCLKFQIQMKNNNK